MPRLATAKVTPRAPSTGIGRPPASRLPPPPPPKAPKPFRICERSLVPRLLAHAIAGQQHASGSSTRSSACAARAADARPSRTRRERTGARRPPGTPTPRLTLPFDQARGAPRLRASVSPTWRDEETQANKRHISQESDRATNDFMQPQLIDHRRYVATVCFFFHAIDARYQQVQARLDRFVDTLDLCQCFGTLLDLPAARLLFMLT
jgi:hypothetical protein